MDNHNISGNFEQEKFINKRNNIISNLRPGQDQLAQWQTGAMAVSAVPGAGKSHSLAVAATLTIAKNKLNTRKYLIIVTYTRSAAASIKQKIQQNLEELKLPVTGFVVQTLHGLALSIASRHPELCGLNLDYSTLITPTPSHYIIRDCVEKWIHLNPARYQLLLEGQDSFGGDDSERLRRQSVLRTEVLPSLAHTVIREAKSSGLSPEEIWDLQYHSSDEYELMAVASGLYLQYQNLMQEKNLIDYDDLILAALRVLGYPQREKPSQQQARKFWQEQVFAVFEDEAQDSSPLQGDLINILANDDNQPNLSPNLVRVGDPNQAINSTFTPADPVYFNWFCEDCKLEGQLATMTQAGRSTKIIIEAANQTLTWVNKKTWHKQKQNPSEFLVNQLPFRAQNIELVNNSTDENINPSPEGQGLEIYTPIDINETIKLIAQRIIKLWAKPEDKDNSNLAILVRENNQGKFLESQLEFLKTDHNIKIKFINDQQNYAHIPQQILALLKFIDRPHSPDNLKGALEVLQNLGLIPQQDLNSFSIYPENFLYPTPLEPEKSELEKQAQSYCLKLLKARLELPHYQLITFLGITLNFNGSELATLHKLSERINQEILGRSSLKTTIITLETIIQAEKFEGVEEEGEEIYTKKGQVTILTMHKAKGLDWDYVFLPFLHNKTLPGEPYVPKQAEFLGNFSLPEVTRAIIRSAVHQQKSEGFIDKFPSIIEAWQEANQLKKGEEYRLLYVAMTRAKKLLWMSSAENAPFLWQFVNDNNSHPSCQKLDPCPVILMLKKGFPQCVF